MLGMVSGAIVAGVATKKGREIMKNFIVELKELSTVKQDAEFLPITLENNFKIEDYETTASFLDKFAVNSFENVEVEGHSL